MNTLFTDKMASVYDAMYQTFIDYNEEYDFYNTLIQKYGSQSTLEIGSGTGNLALRFFKTIKSIWGLTQVRT